MKYLMQYSPEAALDSCRIILKAYAQYFDRYETPIKEPNILLLAAVDLFLLLTDEPIPELKRICHHLSQLHFNDTLDEERSH
jgi:hypothetical protein